MHDGITIDLSAMKTITVAPDNASVTIGAGSRWEEVYPKLATYGLAAAGGRAGPVGVGGFTLGGRTSRIIKFGGMLTFPTRWKVVLFVENRICLRQRQEI